jgi:hypothetical protein
LGEPIILVMEVVDLHLSFSEFLAIEVKLISLIVIASSNLRG